MIVFEDYELELEGGRFNLYRRRANTTPTADDMLDDLLGLAEPDADAEQAPDRRGKAMAYSVRLEWAVERIAADIVERRLRERRGAVTELREVVQLWTAELARVRTTLTA